MIRSIGYIFACLLYNPAASVGVPRMDEWMDGAGVVLGRHRPVRAYDTKPVCSRRTPLPLFTGESSDNNLIGLLRPSWRYTDDLEFRPSD